jgi:hypothetical protein
MKINRLIEDLKPQPRFNKRYSQILAIMTPIIIILVYIGAYLDKQFLYIDLPFFFMVLMFIYLSLIYIATIFFADFKTRNIVNYKDYFKYPEKFIIKKSTKICQLISNIIMKKLWKLFWYLLELDAIFGVPYIGRMIN